MTSPDSASTPTVRRSVGDVRLWLGLDALVTGANALVYLVAAAPLSTLLGPQPGFIRSAGVFLAAFAVFVAAVRATRPAGTPVYVIVAINGAWALASLGVALSNRLDLTAVGTVWVIAQALVVAMFAVFQVLALRRRD